MLRVVCVFTHWCAWFLCHNAVWGILAHTALSSRDSLLAIKYGGEWRGGEGGIFETKTVVAQPQHIYLSSLCNVRVYIYIFKKKNTITCLAKTAISSLKESEEQTSPPATPGSLGVHVANSHFSNTSASSGNKGWLQEGKHSLSTSSSSSSSSKARCKKCPAHIILTYLFEK